MREDASNIFLIPAEAISCPISAITDLDGDDGDYIFTVSTNEWSKYFNEYIDECHSTDESTAV